MKKFPVIFTTISLILFTGTLFAAADVRNITTEPVYLCPGQQFTIHFEVKGDINQNLNVAGVISTNTTWDVGTDYLFIGQGNFTHNPPITGWHSYDSPYDYGTPSLTIYFPKTVVTTLPALIPDESTIYIIIKAASQYMNLGGGAAQDTEVQAIEVNCNKRAVDNIANMLQQKSEPVRLSIELCQTNTPTNTPTNTRTFTSTNTRTNTPTNTITNTPTNTITNTLTNTITNTFTYTITNTPTNTFTLTNTRTNTPTNTQTNTPTDTPTRTFTPTETWTGTPPPTWTPTNTYTDTNTRTNTPTWTETNTPTNTWTPTWTRTNTSTFTDTNTPTNTNTRTNTATPTCTRTDTPTPTETWTGIPPPTWTPTNTWTDTSTPTNTWTITNTSTNTNTRTFTPTSTDTQPSTPTDTSTSTNTRTNTPTWTVTNTPTNTNTRTNTNTPTDTWTATWTNTITSTFTSTYTATDTPTQTATPTITLTLPPFPYIIKISIYNEAGEVVRELVVERASEVIGEIKLTSGGQEINTITNKSLLEINLPGVETPQTIGQGGSVFIWDAKNDIGQVVKQGVYYIKVEEKDGYGHTNVLIKDINVMKEEQYVEVRIFNSAGELVKVIREEKAQIPENIILVVENIIPIEEEGSEIIISYGSEPGANVRWDGRNEKGEVVTSGTYEVQIITKTEQGLKVQASKTVIILNEGKEFISNIKIKPNPIEKGKVSKVKIAWESEGEGRVRVYIYNIAGELVRKIEGRLEEGYIEWDLKIGSGAVVSHGNYIMVIEGISKSGYINRVKAKTAIIK